MKSQYHEEGGYVPVRTTSYELQLIKTLTVSVLAGVVCYFVGLFGGIYLVDALSSNRHDRTLEAAMTSALVIGPGTAIAAFVVTLLYRVVRAKRD